MRVIFILTVILTLAITSMSCLPSKPATPVISATDAAQDVGIAAIKVAVQTLDSSKASNDTINAMKTQIAVLEGRSGANSYDKTVLYTKTEVDAQIAAAVTALKADQAWVKGTVGIGGTGGTSTVPVTGQVTYNIYKEPDIAYTAGSYVWYLEVMNGTTEYKKVYISGVLNTVDTYASRVDIALTKFNSPDLVGGLTSGSNGPFSMNFVPTDGVHCSMMSGMSTGYVIIKGGEKKLVAIFLTLNYVTGTSELSRWEAVWSLNPQKYP